MGRAVKTHTSGVFSEVKCCMVGAGPKRASYRAASAASGRSSSGRASDSKSVGWWFEPILLRQSGVRSRKVTAPLAKLRTETRVTETSIRKARWHNAPWQASLQRAVSELSEPECRQLLETLSAGALTRMLGVVAHEPHWDGTELVMGVSYESADSRELAEMSYALGDAPVTVGMASFGDDAWLEYRVQW
jgi:hypothetical protein